MLARRRRVAQILSSVLASVTQDRYNKAVANFQEWLFAERLAFDALPPEEQDLVLADFGLTQREQGAPLQDFRDLLAALQKYYPSRPLKTSWKVITAWSKDRPPQQVPPMPEELAGAMAVLLAAAGRPGIGMMIALSFAGMLRISEALRLRWRDLYPSERGLMLRLAETKAGCTEYVVIQNPHTAKFVLGLRPPGALDDDRLCPVGYSSFRFWFQCAAKVLGRGQLGLKCHSLRRGGATSRLTRGYALAQIMVEGRWASEGSCRLYLKSSEAAILAMRRDLRPEKKVLVETLAGAWAQVVV